MNNKITVEEIHADRIRVAKKKGNITVKEIQDALRDNGYEYDTFVMFIKATTYDGWTDRDMEPINAVEIMTTFTTCPVCGKEGTDRAWNDGYEVGRKSAQA